MDTWSISQHLLSEQLELCRVSIESRPAWLASDSLIATIKLHYAVAYGGNVPSRIPFVNLLDCKHVAVKTGDKQDIYNWP